VFVEGVILRVMRLGVGMRMAVHTGTVSMLVGMDDDLARCIAAAAVLGADFSDSHALGAIFQAMLFFVFVHDYLLGQQTICHADY
jgi:hypothetical protein